MFGDLTKGGAPRRPTMSGGAPAQSRERRPCAVSKSVHSKSIVADLPIKSYHLSKRRLPMAKRSITKKKFRVTAFLAKRSGASPMSRSSRGGATKRPMVVFRSFLATETSTAKKIELIRSGVTARVVDDMVEYLHVSKNEIFKVLRTPESTAHKLIKDDRPLDAGASERVVRVADITRIAEDTFGGREAATQWLKTPNLALDTATPLSMLDTEPGASEVRRILSAINHGGAF